MLIQLTPEQIPGRWWLLKKSVLESHPPTVKMGMNYFTYVLSDLYTGRKQAWLGYDGEKEVLVGITSIINDIDDGTPYLMIYSIFGLTNHPISNDFWLDAYDALMEFCKGTGIEKIYGYTTYPDVAKLAKRFGVLTEWRMIEMEVQDG